VTVPHFLFKTVYAHIDQTALWHQISAHCSAGGKSMLVSSGVVLRSEAGSRFRRESEDAARGVLRLDMATQTVIGTCGSNGTAGDS